MDAVGRLAVLREGDAVAATDDRPSAAGRTIAVVGIAGEQRSLTRGLSMRLDAQEDPDGGADRNDEKSSVDNPPEGHGSEG